ncbi:putative HET-domain-containing protein [Seiridium cardinale]|uniref:HET-domain-containing protein n=1 Tax=Seiridium cardinale TaxID=138064 RepID=A0ABR2Y530_9PEZI
MRLINSETIHFEEFTDDHISKYVILSHTWGEDEVSYKEMDRALRRLSSSSQQPAIDKEGFSKIAKCAKKGFIAACAELQEAINSMYDWNPLARTPNSGILDGSKEAGRSRKRTLA